MSSDVPIVVHSKLPQHAQSFGGDSIGDFSIAESRHLPASTAVDHISQRNFKVAFCRDGLNCSNPEVRNIAHIRESDVATFAGFYFDKNSKLNLILSERFSWGVRNGYLMLPRRYLLEGSRSADLGAAVQNLVRRADVQVKSGPRLLSGPTVPLPGLLPTIEFPFCAEIDPSSFASRVFFDKFYGPITFRGVRSKDIIGNLLRHNFQDLHALYAALKVETLHGIKSPIPNDVVTRLREGASQKVENDWISTADKLEELIWGQPPPGVPDSLQCTSCASVAPSFFTIISEDLERRYRGYAQPHNVTGQVVKLNNGLDTQVIVVGYVRGRDEAGAPDVHLLANVGNRELFAREMVRHAIQTEEPQRSIEPWSFYSQGIPSLTEIASRFSEMSGMKTLSPPIPLGSFYQSPEFAEVRSELFLVEIDAQTFTHKPRVPDMWQSLVPLSEVRKSAEEGIIASLPLATVAEIIGRGFEYSFKDDRPFRLPEELESLNQRIRKGSDYRELLEQNFGKQFANLAHSEEFYRLLEHAFNQGFGLKAEGTDFYSCVPEFGLLPELPPLQRFVLLVHDVWHGEEGELIPWIFTKTPPVMIAKPVFIKAFLSNEAGSVYFSEVELAKAYGFEKWRAESGQFSLGEVLSICGIRDKLEARRAVMSIVREGTIPDSIRFHERFKEFQDTVLHFLGYHFRDIRNGEVAYEFWKQHPETARAILEFNPRCTNSAAQHLRNIYRTSDRISSSQHRGINPFKHDIRKLATTDLLKTAIRVGYLLDIASDPATQAKLIEIQTELRSLKNATIAAAEKVRGVHSSSRNVHAVRRSEIIEEKLADIRSEVTALVMAMNLPGSEQDRILNRIPLWHATFHLTEMDQSKLNETMLRLQN